MGRDPEGCTSEVEGPAAADRLVTSALRCSGREAVAMGIGRLQPWVRVRSRVVSRLLQRNALVMSRSAAAGPATLTVGTPFGVILHGYSRKYRVLYGRFIE